MIPINVLMLLTPLRVQDLELRNKEYRSHWSYRTHVLCNQKPRLYKKGGVVCGLVVPVDEVGLVVGLRIVPFVLALLELPDEPEDKPPE